MTTHAETPHIERELLPEEATSLGQRLTQVGVGVLIFAVIFGVRAKDELAHFSHAYLVSFCFFLSISLGGLFFVMIQHITRSGWSVIVRRMAEILIGVFPVLAVAALPIVVAVALGAKQPFSWNDPAFVSTHELVAHKQPYLNPLFFVIRMGIYFGVWCWLSARLNAMSFAQDRTRDPELSNRLEGLSAPGLILAALTSTFASFDLLMSLDPEWFSTIFGVHFFAGSMVGFFTTSLLLISILQLVYGKLQSVTIEHRHDLSKLLFAFMCFWAYIAFSQYLLIWYSNIPEETVWYARRQEGGWQWVSIALIVGHFAVPFVGFMSRTVKRSPVAMFGWASLLLLLHWVDLYWVVMPEFSKTPVIGLIDVLLFVGLGCVWLGAVIRQASQQSLVAVGDPRLPESLAFHNI